MNTPGHAVVSLAAFGGRDRPGRHVPLAVGALLPDVPMVAFYLHVKLVEGLPETVIWSQAYFRPGWQAVFDTAHSIPLAAAVAAAGSWAGRTWEGGTWIGWVGVSALVHDLVDLPLHSGDAHAHLVPFTDWRFRSPVSYWDPGRHGDVVGTLEAAVVVALSVVVWNKLESRWGRALLCGAAGVYVLGLGLRAWA